MGRHAKPGLGAGQLASIAIAGAVVAGAAGAAIVRMAGGGGEFEPASSAVPAGPTPAPAAAAVAAPRVAAPGVAPAGETGPDGEEGAAASGAAPYPRTAVSTVSGLNDEHVSTRIVAGSVTRVLSGLRPVRWFADGTVLLQGDDGPRETVVYDPVAGRYVARRPDLFGSRGLAPTSGPGAAPQSFFAPPAEGDRTLVEVSSELKEKRTRLPAGKPPRAYRAAGAVRVGGAVFVPYGRSRADDELGVLRLDGRRTSAVLQGRRVERLAVSSDYRHLMALVRMPAPAGSRGLRIMAVDPDTGAITRRLRLPVADGRRLVRVGLFDRVGPRYAVQVSRTCRPAAPASCADGPTQTWRWESGRWARVPGTAGKVVLWQSADSAISWTLPDGPVVFHSDGRRREVHTNSKQGVHAPGSLLRPA